MSNLLPEGWEQCAIGKKFKFLGGYAFKSLDNVDSGTRWLKIANVGIGKIKWEERSFLPSNFINDHPNYVLSQGDCVVALTRPIIRGELKVAKISSFDSPSLLNQRVAKVKFNSDLIDNDFVYSMMRYEEISREIEITIFGTDPPNLSTKQFEEIKFNFPPISEQQKIAKILTSVDEVIEKTQAQIDKLKDLKTGMMQELLTNGIGHTEFKDSPVGRIPAEWDVVRVDEIVTKVGSGVTPKGGSKAYVSSGIPLIRSQNVHSDGLRLDNVSFITAEQHQKMKGSQLQANDVLLNITGASIGRCYYLADDFIEGNVNQHVCIIRLKKNMVSHVFITLLLNGQLGQTQIMSLQAGGNREGLNFQQIREIKLPLPPIEEQVKISNTLSSIEREVRIKESKLNAVIKIKKALMQDLLTGKVRVKTDSKK